MSQEIIIKRDQYYVETEELNITSLKMDFSKTHFHTYDIYRDYLHIQVDGYDGFNFYLEISPREAEEFFLKLAEQARKMYLGF